MLLFLCCYVVINTVYTYVCYVYVYVLLYLVLRVVVIFEGLLLVFEKPFRIDIFVSKSFTELRTFNHLYVIISINVVLGT